ncbi:MAG: RNA-guided pseudouridylation complex pseudouridine synthase subunit Cbf5 [Nitrososphaerales archaeon]
MSINYIFLRKDETDDNYGYYFDKRPLNALLDYGLILLDKPPGPTSHQIVAWVRKMLSIEKVGHSGTLDPPVTGLLPIGLGNATKALPVLLLGPKEYFAVARLHASLPESKLQETLQEFTGEIYQRPPQRSSVKRVVRTRRIYELELIEKKGNLFLLRVLCQAGTYVRKLIFDIGEVLGVGATMVELRRTKVSPFKEEDGLTTLHELLDALYEWKENGREDKMRKIVKPIELAFFNMKKVYVRDSAVDAICHGAQLAIPGIAGLSQNIEVGEPVGLFTLKEEIIALAKALKSTKEIISEDRGLAFNIERVIMKAGTYPRMWKSSKKKV